MKTLVTGGAGYIGSHACQVLRKAGHEIAVLDNLFQGHRDAVDPDVPFFEVDLNDRAGLDGALDAFQPDADDVAANVKIDPETPRTVA